MNKQRKSYTPDEKVAIIRQHLLDGVAISELCDAQGLHPTLYYRWQKEFFEGGAAAFAKVSSPGRLLISETNSSGCFTRHCSRASTGHTWPSARCGRW